jgi:lipoyl synthase
MATYELSIEKPTRKLPPWLKVRAPGSEGYRRIKGLVHTHTLHTVCEEARCPNIGECWGHGTATFMILGDVCTRSCRFCAIKTGKPPAYDREEPARVAEAVATLKLRHTVLTSVNRDELPDGGAWVFAETIRQIRQRSPGTTIEVLIPDFMGDKAALAAVFEERPDILNHNMETVSRLYRTIRPQAIYERSLDVLRGAKAAGLTAKTGIMVGLGETRDEVRTLIGDVAATGCDIMTIGQYLRPTPKHVAIDRFYEPHEFDEMKVEGEGMGLTHVESGPLVRSSYHSAEQVDLVK